MTEAQWMMVLLALLVGAFISFLLSVGYRLSIGKGGDASCQWKTHIWGGIGFLFFGLDGLLSARFLDTGFHKTAIIALIFWLGGGVLLHVGLSIRSKMKAQSPPK